VFSFDSRNESYRILAHNTRIYSSTNITKRSSHVPFAFS